MLTQSNTIKIKSPYLSRIPSSEQQQELPSHKRYEIIEEIINTEIIQNTRSILVDSSTHIQPRDILLLNLNKEIQTDELKKKLSKKIQIERLHCSLQNNKSNKLNNCPVNLWNKHNLNEAIHKAYKEKESNYLNLLIKLDSDNSKQNKKSINRIQSCRINNSKPKWVPAGGYNYSWTREALNKGKNNNLFETNILNKQQITTISAELIDTKN